MISFGAPIWFWALLVIPVLALLFARAEQRGIARLREFVSPRLLPQLAATVNRSRRVFRFALLMLGLALAIVSLARLFSQKGIADLIAAFASLGAAFPTASLYLVGEGPGQPADRAQAGGGAFSAPADLVLLVNSAAESIYAKELTDMFRVVGQRGHISPERPLTAVILKGLLSTRLETVNMVNAPVIARQNDIKVTEARSDQSPDYQTAIRVTVNAGAAARTITGTLFGDKPRIVSIDGVPTEAELTPHMLLIENLDKPGFIGSLGRTLGDGQINIAAFHNGRLAEGQRAFCLVSVDQRIDDSLLKRIGSLPNVVSVTDLTF